jgi:hypothetical protein
METLSIIAPNIVMLSVANKRIMLSVFMLSVIKLNVVKPNVVAPLSHLEVFPGACQKYTF